MPYVVRRVLYAVVVIWAAYTITWLLLYAMPGDPVTIMLKGAGSASEATKDALAHRYGLDQPFFLQYFTLLWRILTGTIGPSIQLGAPVTQLIANALPHTLALGAAALLVSAVLGLGLGLLSNTVRGAFLRSVLTSLPSVFVAFPTFLVGLVLVDVFAFGLHLVPAVGTSGIQGLILPAITSGIPASAAIAQVTSKAIGAHLASPAATYLVARGVPRWRILFSHALRNALIPGVTILGMQVGGILAGAVITETIFSRDGLGRVMQQGVLNQDIPVVQYVALVSAALYVVSNLVVDLVYPIIDPRIRKAAAR